MSNPVGVVAPPYIASPQPLRLDALPAATPQSPQDDAAALPLGRPAIPLPIESFLPYRDPETPDTAPSPQEQFAAKIADALAAVSADAPEPNAVDIRVPAPLPASPA